MNKQELDYQGFFEGIGKRNSRKNVYRTSQEWAESGVKYLKRKTLGLCGRESYKTLEDLSNLLLNNGLVKGDTERIIESFDKKAFQYGWSLDISDRVRPQPLFLLFEKVEDMSWNKKLYKISKAEDGDFSTKKFSPTKFSTKKWS